MLLILIACALGNDICAGSTSTMVGNGVRMELTPVFDGLNPGFGTIPFKLTVVNDNRVDGSWTINVLTSRLSVTQTEQNHISVAANSTGTFWIYATVPCNGSNYSDYYGNYIRYSLTASGTGINGAEQIDDSSFTPNSPTISAPTRVCSIDAGTDCAGAIVCSDVNFPKDWQGYTGVQSLILTLTDWKRLNKPQQLAILQWVGIGGSLFFDSMTLDQLNDASLDMLAKPRAFNTTNYGAGVITLGMRSTEAVLGPVQWMHSFDSPINWNWEAQLPHIVVPKLTILIILVGFILLAGPINIVYLAPQQRRLRLFITVPVIALSAGLILFFGIVFSEGFGGVGKRFLVIYSLPSLHAEAVWQEEVSKTHVLISSAWQNTDHALSVKYRFSEGYLQNDSPSNLNQDGEFMTGDWYGNRAIQVLYLQAVRPSRSELILKPGLKIQSVFPVAMWQVHLAYRGQFYHVQGLGIGELKACETETREDFNHFVNFAFLHGDANIKPKQSDFQSDLFFAVPETVPESLALHTLSSVRWEDTDAVYTGQFDNQSGAAP